MDSNGLAQHRRRRVGERPHDSCMLQGNRAMRMSRRIAAEQGRRLQSWHALHRRLADDIIAVNDTVPSTFFYPLESIRDQSGSRARSQTLRTAARARTPTRGTARVVVMEAS